MTYQARHRHTPTHRRHTQTAAKASGAVAAAGIATASLANPMAAEAVPASNLTNQAHVHDAVQVVVAQKGDPYVYGAEGPNAFDCSGLMEYAFAKVGVYMPRVSHDQSQFVTRIPASKANRGDFVYWYDSSGHVFHTAMVAGHRKGKIRVLEAQRTGTRISNNPLWNAPHFFGSMRQRHHS